MKRKRHKWPQDSTIRTVYYTVRTCPVCGLDKVTDHNDVFPRLFYRLGAETFNKMPECEIVE